MSQNQKNKTSCHPELVSGSIKEDIMPNGFRLGGRNDKRVQSGRSMVEMLGTLAIMGVLTIGGIAGYRYAINKSNTNTILGAVSQMAVTASTELTTQGSLTLPEWKDTNGNLSISGAFGVETAQYDDGTFSITVSNMNDEVCERIKGMDWKVPEDVAINGKSDSCDQGEANAIEFVFSNTLTKRNSNSSNPSIDDSIDNEDDCSAQGKTWCSGLNDGAGACSNTSDCCAGITLDNSCQKCVPYTGEVTDKTDTAPCSTNGNSEQDGICFRVEPAGTTCGEDNLDTLCYNHVQYQPSQQMNCIPLSCALVGTCCAEFHNEDLASQINEQRALGKQSHVDALTAQYNKKQCSNCHDRTGQISNKEDGTDCSHMTNNSSTALPGVCRNGTCQLAPGSCTSYRDCNSGEYCQFPTRNNKVDTSVGTCQSIATCNQIGTYTASDNRSYTMFSTNSDCITDWYSAQDICKSQGKIMVSLSDMKCHEGEGVDMFCTSHFWEEFKTNLSNNQIWTSTEYNNDYAVRFLLNLGYIAYFMKTSQISVLCRSN